MARLTALLAVVGVAFFALGMAVALAGVHYGSLVTVIVGLFLAIFVAIPMILMPVLLVAAEEETTWRRAEAEYLRIAAMRVARGEKNE